ncbi:MAG: carbohydrate kinase [Lachnospiraceae bacterium]|nr:carbohydrate kinase [Lachnospiraceae bacterium]
MAKTIDVTALGELLIDFTESGTSSRGNPLLEENPGGAPCNVLAMLSKLGRKTAFIGKVGADSFGSRLKSAVSSAGIDTSGLVTDNTVNTTLAFVHTLENGDRDFSFYRNPGADMMLKADEINDALIEDCGIFHFGTLSMTAECCRDATEKAVAAAKKSGALISFDPNIRKPLWNDLETARERTVWGLRNCDILKISDNETEWLTGTNDYKKAALQLKRQYGISLVLVSLGRNGSIALSNSAFAEMPSYKVNAVETTGAGDTFCACVLNYVLENGLKDYTSSELEEMLRFANAAAAIVTTRKGALAVMPERSEIEELILKYGRN